MSTMMAKQTSVGTEFLSTFRMLTVVSFLKRRRSEPACHWWGCYEMDRSAICSCVSVSVCVCCQVE